jgi:hypothetical protein
VADIDLLMGADDARDLLRRTGAEAIATGGSDLFRSDLRGQFFAGTKPVDVMAGLRVNGAGGWLKVSLRTRREVRLEDSVLWVPEREELVTLFRLFGREKDLARAALLEALPGG